MICTIGLETIRGAPRESVASLRAERLAAGEPTKSCRTTPCIGTGDLTGKHLVVYHEEGSGDFISGMPLHSIACANGSRQALSYAGRCRFLLDLVADNIEVDGIVPLSEFGADYVVGSWSVPWRTGVTYADVSGKPYFAAEPLKLPSAAS